MFFKLREIFIVICVSLVFASLFPLVNLLSYFNAQENSLAFTQGNVDEGIIITGYSLSKFDYTYPFDYSANFSLFTPNLPYFTYAVLEKLNVLQIDPIIYNCLLVFLLSFFYVLSTYFVIKRFVTENVALQVFLLVCFIPSLAVFGFLVFNLLLGITSISFSYGPGSLVSYSLVESAFAMASRVLRVYYLIPLLCINLGILALFHNKALLAAMFLAVATFVHPAVGGLMGIIILSIISIFRFRKYGVVLFFIAGVVIGALPWFISYLSDSFYFKFYYDFDSDYGRAGGRILLILFDLLLLLFLSLSRKGVAVFLLAFSIQLILSAAFFVLDFNVKWYTSLSFFAFLPFFYFYLAKSEKPLYLRVLVGVLGTLAVFPGHWAPVSGIRFLLFLPIPLLVLICNERVAKYFPILVVIGVLNFAVFGANYFFDKKDHFLMDNDDFAAINGLNNYPKGITVSNFNFTTMVAYAGFKQPFYPPPGLYSIKSKGNQIAINDFYSFGKFNCSYFEGENVSYVFLEKSAKIDVPKNFVLLYNINGSRMYKFNRC